MRFSYILIIAFIISVIGITPLIRPIRLASEKIIEVPYGTSVYKSGDILKDAGIIRSKEVYMLASKILYPNGIVAGRYSFSGKISVFSVLRQMTNGDFGRDQIKLTIPEGFTIDKTIARIYNLFPEIDKTYIKNSLGDKEGYIFPETYFFDKDVPAEELVLDIINKSNAKLKSILKVDNLNTADVRKKIIIASLVESEGRTYDERRMIAGIIDNRLEINMALQLDATLQYITGKGSAELTLKDLKTDSPYNTYVYRGLPPSPISNPGKESIEAVLNKKDNDYLFYLHDNKGQIYYAKTFEEHVRNKNKYLK